MKKIAPRNRPGARDTRVCRSLAGRFLLGDGAQDMVEYALLAAFIGVAGILVLNTMGATIFTTYSSWISPTVGLPSIWDPAPPLSSGGGS